MWGCAAPMEGGVSSPPRGLPPARPHPRPLPCPRLVPPLPLHPWLLGWSPVHSGLLETARRRGLLPQWTCPRWVGPWRASAPATPPRGPGEDTHPSAQQDTGQQAPGTEGTGQTGAGLPPLHLAPGQPGVVPSRPRSPCTRPHPRGRPRSGRASGHGRPPGVRQNCSSGRLAVGVLGAPQLSTWHPRVSSQPGICGALLNAHYSFKTRDRQKAELPFRSRDAICRRVKGYSKLLSQMERSLSTYV